MENTLTSPQFAPAAAESTPAQATTDRACAVAANDEQPPQKLKSLKFLYVGLAWAIGYPSTACLIGYVVSVTSGVPSIA